MRTAKPQEVSVRTFQILITAVTFRLRVVTLMSQECQRTSEWLPSPVLSFFFRCIYLFKRNKERREEGQGEREGENLKV